MAGKFPGLVLIGGTFYVRKVVPADVREKVGKRELLESLKTGDPREAERFYPEVMRRFKKNIADARAPRLRSSAVSSFTLVDARRALFNWVQDFTRRVDDDQTLGGALVTAWDFPNRVAPLQEIFEKGGDATVQPEFDGVMIEMLRKGGLSVVAGDPILDEVRNEAALTMAHALRYEERERLARAHEQAAERSRGAFLDEVGAAPQLVAKPLPPASLTLRALFDEWKTTLPVAPKEIGRLEHQIRRLIEVVGNKPASHVTRSEVREFMTLVARFPGRKRPVNLNALPMRKLIEKFEADNAAIIARNAASKPGETLEDVPSTLAATTVGEWFSGYRRMYEWAIEEKYLDISPFEGRHLQITAVKGAPSQKKRHFTEAEIKTIFGAPMFQGFEGDGLTGYRKLAGTNIVRDAKYWLPILGLHHGGRLTEFAAMPVADLKQTEAGSWYFDLTARQVKNETSQRLIPLHPKMIELGFLEYVAKLRKGNSPWLFPDLDHETRHGPGHAFSKWWGSWMDAHGLSDPAISHHSWRHTFKRQARMSDVKEEMHDVLTGHTNASVGRSYGGGADIEPLVRDMAKIVFPAFPAIPVAAAA